MPRLVLGAVGWLLVGAALPWPGGWLLLALLIVGAIACLRAETVMVRLLWWARPSSSPAMVAQTPSTVLMSSRRRPVVAVAGQRHLVVSKSADPRSSRVRLLVGTAALQQRAAAGPFDVVYRWFVLPWLLVAAVADSIGAPLCRLLLIGFAWRVRPIITGIAIIQSVADGRWPSAVIVAVVIGLTYLLPWTLHHQRRVVELEVPPCAEPTPNVPVPTPAVLAAAGTRAVWRHDRDPASAYLADQAGRAPQQLVAQVHGAVQVEDVRVEELRRRLEDADCHRPATRPRP